MEAPATIYRGEVVHKRVRPVEHKLRYRVFSMFIDVDRLAEVDKISPLFAVDRFSLFSLRQGDHGFRNQQSLSEFAWDTVRKAGAEDIVKSIDMLFYPRILGLAFNPLTVYFCRDNRGNPALMIYEVRNTFGEDLTYVLPAGAAINGVYSHTMEKAFYVSPYNQVEGDYTFHTKAPGDELTVGVALKSDGKPVLRTHFRGSGATFSTRQLLKLFARYPLMTLKIVGGIHWEALKLWRKGMSLQDRPPPPAARIIFAPNSSATTSFS